MLITVLSLISKWLSINYERQISENIKLRINIIEVIIMFMNMVLVNKMVVNQGSANGICSDRLG